MPATVLSFVNFKGGVGKTTIAINVAAHLALDHHKRVLLVDLDPQLSATLYLIGEERYREWIEGENPTLNELFEKYISQETRPPIRRAIIRRPLDIPRYPELANIDLLLNRLNMIDIDDRTGHIDGRETILSRELEGIKDEYDYIICDCPPNLSILTRNGIFASDCFVVPVIPDYLSTSGLLLLFRRLRGILNCHTRLLGRLEEPICIGVICTKVRRIRTHEYHLRVLPQILRDIKNKGFVDYDIEVIEPYIRERAGIAEAAGQHRPACAASGISNKHEIVQDFRSLTNNILIKLEEGV